MAFVTKVDYSDNRQIKQYLLTDTQLSGATTFGIADALIPMNVSGDTINIDALQYIQARGIILPNSLPLFTGATSQILGRDNDTGKIVEIELSGVTFTGGSDYVVSSSFNIGTGDLTLTRVSGGTVITNLDGRYLTGTTEIVESIANPLNVYFANRVKPVSDNEGFYVNASSNKDSGYLVNNTDTVGNAALAGFRATVNGDPFGNGFYFGVPNTNYFAPWLREHGIITGKDLNIMVGTNAGTISFSQGNTSTNQITEAQQDKVLLFNTDRTIVAPSLSKTLIEGESSGRILTTREFLESNYVKIGKRIIVSGATSYNFDHSLATDWKFYMTGATTFSDSNLPSGDTIIEFTVKLTGNFTVTWPVYWDVIGDTYDGTIWNFIVVRVHDGNSGTEEVTALISNIV